MWVRIVTPITHSVNGIDVHKVTHFTRVGTKVHTLHEIHRNVSIIQTLVTIPFSNFLECHAYIIV